MKKKRTYNIRLIRARSSYSTSEIANVLGVHISTVRTWHKQGMVSLNPGENQLLFKGYAIKEFLDRRQKGRKIKLKENEFYCTRCRLPRKSNPKNIEFIDTNKRIGRDDWQIIIRGKCVVCGCKLNRFHTKNKLKTSVWGRMIKEGHKVLKGN